MTLLAQSNSTYPKAFVMTKKPLRIPPPRLRSTDEVRLIEKPLIVRRSVIGLHWRKRAGPLVWAAAVISALAFLMLSG